MLGCTYLGAKITKSILYISLLALFFASPLNNFMKKPLFSLSFSEFDVSRMVLDDFTS